MSTTLRRRKSAAASVPARIGVEARSAPRLSLDATDAAREMPGGSWAPDLGVGACENDGGVGVPELVAASVGPLLLFATAVGAGVGSAGPFRLPLMIAESSVLNLSRSFSATGWLARKVKLYPASSLTSASFRRTCAAPSLLQNRAGGS